MPDWEEKEHQLWKKNVFNLPKAGTVEEIDVSALHGRYAR